MTSESLHADSLTLPGATRLIARQFEVISARKQDGGCLLMQASAKTANEINKQQLYQALVDFVCLCNVRKLCCQILGRLQCVLSMVRPS